MSTENSVGPNFTIDAYSDHVSLYFHTAGFASRVDLSPAAATSLGMNLLLASEEAGFVREDLRLEERRKEINDEKAEIIRLLVEDEE